jgi:hypothetical protein
LLSVANTPKPYTELKNEPTKTRRALGVYMKGGIDDEFTKLFFHAFLFKKEKREQKKTLRKFHHKK